VFSVGGCTHKKTKIKLDIPAENLYCVVA
jgi:hypothetical protein